MKRLILILLSFIIFSALLWLGYFYWKNLRGVSPALKPPPQDISKILNTTGMPLTLPKGFDISVFASGLGSPRVLAMDPSGNLVASIPSQGRVVALPDKNGDGVADKVIDVITGLNRPHGLAFLPCYEKESREVCELYVAETHQVNVFEYNRTTLTAEKRYTDNPLIKLPAGGNHFTRTLLLTPQDQWLVSVGSSCNVCEEKDERRATILQIENDQGDFRVHAAGLRNSVFMTLHPVTGDVWATEMGRDLLGDDLPPDEINIIKEGKNYGWSYCYEKQVHDENFDPSGAKKEFCATASEPSKIDLPAHSAPLGLAFIPEEGWPEAWWYDLLVAFHGSWNRSEPTGYKIVRFPLDAHGNSEGEPEDFISGWITPQGALGRPVDILVFPGGTIYISDDKAGVIYRMGVAQ